MFLLGNGISDEYHVIRHMMNLEAGNMNSFCVFAFPYEHRLCILIQYPLTCYYTPVMSLVLCFVSSQYL